MKTLRISLILPLLILGSLLLTACTGASLVHSWPELSASQNTVYLAYGGQIFAVNAENGVLAWRFPEKADNSKPFYAAPAVTDNLIVAGSYGHMLYGLGTDGKQKWAFDSQNGNFVGSPLVVKDFILAPSSNFTLYALSLDGKQRWTFDTKNGLWATPASDGQTVFLPALDHNLYALRLADGSLAWKKDLGSALLSAPLLTSDGTLYVSTMDGNLDALKAADGSQVWSTKTGGRLWSSPVLQGDSLFIGNASGKVTAVSTKDGKITWQKDAGSPILGGGALIPQGVVFGTEGGSAIAYPFSGEKELWRQPINGKLYSTPVVAGQILAVSILEGDKLIQAFNENGQTSWSFVMPK